MTERSTRGPALSAGLRPERRPATRAHVLRRLSAGLVLLALSAPRAQASPPAVPAPDERIAPLPVTAAPPPPGESTMPHILWTKELPDTPVGGVAADGGLVFVALIDGTLRAYRVADGRELWHRDLGESPQTGPAVGGGLVLVVDTAKRLRAFAAADGSPRWDATLAAQASSEIAAGDTVCALGVGNKTCAAFSLADGKLLWRVAAMGDVVGAPWIGDSTVVFGSSGHTVYAVAKLSGEVSREFVMSGEVYGRPGGEPGTGALVTVGTHEGRLHALTLSWTRPWSARVRGIPRAAPLEMPDTVYAGTDQAIVYALDRSDGSVRWMTGVGGPVRERLVALPGRLAVGAGGAISFLSMATGRLVRDLAVGGLITGLAADAGTVVAATSARNLVAAGVRVGETAAPAEAEAALASVIVEPARVNVREGIGTVVIFSLRQPRPLVVDVADARGRRVRLLANRDRAWPDTYRFEWDGRDENKKPVKPGVYRVRVDAGEEDVSVGIDVVGRK